jgi:hypothetical protein
LRGLARSGGSAELASIWIEVAGSTIAGKTRVMGIKRGVLQIAVSNSPLLSELASFHKESLLSNLQQKHSHLKIRDLKFRLKGDLAG